MSETPNFARIGMIFSTEFSTKYCNSGIVNYIPEMYSISCSKSKNNLTQDICYNFNDLNDISLSQNTQQKLYIKKSFWDCFKNN